MRENILIFDVREGEEGKTAIEPLVVIAEIVKYCNDAAFKAERILISVGARAAYAEVTPIPTIQQAGEII